MFGIFRRFNKRIGLDIGAAGVRIYSYARDQVYDEPDVIVYARKRQVVAAGTNAGDMLGRTPRGITAIRPFSYGLATDPQALTDLLADMMDRHRIARAGLFKLKVDVCAMYGLDDIEQTNILKAVLGAGNIRATIVDKTLAAAIHEGYNWQSWDSMMVAGIGRDTCEAAVLSYGGIVSFKQMKIGSGSIDQSIISYVRRNYGVLISANTAENIKKKLCSAIGSKESDAITMFKGVDLASGMPRDMSVTAGELQECVDEITTQILDMIKTVLQKTPYELLPGLQKRGMTLTGGGALMSGMVPFISEGIGIPVKLSDEPIHGTVLGAIDAGRFMLQRSNIKEISRVKS